MVLIKVDSINQLDCKHLIEKVFDKSLFFESSEF